MRTTLDLDPSRIRRVMRMSGARTKTDAIHRALDAYIRQRRIEALLTLPDRIHFDLDWKALEEAELAEAKGRSARRRG